MSIYQLIIIFLLILYFLGIVNFGMGMVLLQSFPAILSTTIFGALFDYFELKRWTNPKTPFISGLIIGLVAQFGASPLVLIGIGFAAMLVKFLVKWDGRHIFNPAASGLFLGMIFSSYPSWWVGGEQIWIFLIWIPILLYKMKRWAPMVGFLLPLIVGHGLSILTSSSLLFFVSIMLIEPKTSPADTKNGLIYGFVVSIFYFLTSSFTKFDPVIPALLIGNLTNKILARYS